jgi:hypothetical protein
MTDRVTLSDRLIHGYLYANATFGRKHPITGAAWVAKTVLFGKRLVLVGVALLILCVFLPNDGRRLVFVGMGLLTVVVGVWHQRYAPRIFAMAQARRSGN